MLPRSAVGYCLNRATRDTETLPQGALRNMLLEQSSYLYDLGISKFRVGAVFTSTQALWMRSGARAISCRRASFANHVAHIVALCAQKQMIWVDAGRVIATGTVMAHIQSFRDWATQQRPGNTMCRGGASIDADVAMPPRTSMSRPQPAFAGLIDVSPEPIGDGDFQGSVIAGLRAVLRVAVARGKHSRAMSTGEGILGACHLSLLTGWGGAVPQGVGSTAAASCCPQLYQIGRR